MSRVSCLVLVVLLLPVAGALGSPQQVTYDQPPINYSSSKPADAIATLKERLADGALKVEYEDSHGYLKSLLQALDIPASSQSLVFSKTSFQRQWINPKSPRGRRSRAIWD